MNFVLTEFSEVASRGVYALCAPEVNGRSIESMQNFLDGLVRSTKTVTAFWEVPTEQGLWKSEC